MFASYTNYLTTLPSLLSRLEGLGLLHCRWFGGAGNSIYPSAPLTLCAILNSKATTVK